MTLKLTTLTETTGSVVENVMASRMLNIEERVEFRAALAWRGVLVVHKQFLIPEQQVTFTQQFGTPESFPDQRHLGNSNPNIFRISNQGDGFDVGHYWHADRAPFPRPTDISVLAAVEVPEQPPTQTVFLNMVWAYKGLHPALQQTIANLKWNTAARISTPLVGEHPITGQATLSLPFRFPTRASTDDALLDEFEQLNADLKPSIDGFSKLESDALTIVLIKHVLGDPRWQYAHVWEAGDLLLWDQRTVYHHATRSASRRILNRTAVLGRQMLPYSRSSDTRPVTTQAPTLDAR